MFSTLKSFISSFYENSRKAFGGKLYIKHNNFETSFGSYLRAAKKCEAAKQVHLKVVHLEERKGEERKQKHCTVEDKEKGNDKGRKEGMKEKGLG